MSNQDKFQHGHFQPEICSPHLHTSFTPLNKFEAGEAEALFFSLRFHNFHTTGVTKFKERWPHRKVRTIRACTVRTLSSCNRPNDRVCKNKNRTTFNLTVCALAQSNMCLHVLSEVAIVCASPYREQCQWFNHIGPSVLNQFTYTQNRKLWIVFYLLLPLINLFLYCRVQW